MDLQKQILYTIQPKSLVDKIISSNTPVQFKALTCTEFDFKSSYDWMKHQYKIKTGLYLPGDLVWAWVKKPDLRQKKSLVNFQESKHLVVLKLEIDKQRVLVSNFEAWHYVLNKWHLVQHTQCSTSNEVSMKAKRHSWQRIFNQQFCSDMEFSDLQQAVIDQIHKNDIVEIININPPTNKNLHRL